MSKIFVYGTLKPLKHNNYLLNDATHLGEAVVDINFEMRTNGSFPALSPTESVNSITGNVYEVNESTKRRIDQLEGYSGTRDNQNNWYDTADIETPFGSAELYYFKKPVTSWRLLENGKF